jgi:glycosyltransferase involved in cell wall biosynthesis
LNTLIWVSSARYTEPLDTTAAAKWKLLHESLNRDIIVVSFSADGKAHDFIQNVRFVLMPSARWSLLRYLIMLVMMPLTLIRLIRQTEGATLIAQSPFEGAFGALMRQLFPKKTRLIIENHNNFEGDLFLQRRIPFPNLVKALMLMVARYAYRHADATRAVSLTTEARQKAYAPNVPSTRFMAWSDTEAFANATRSIPVDQASDIVYAGVLRPGKGVHVLVEAFAQLQHPSAQLFLIGEAQNADYTAQLRAQVERLNVGQRVHFVGKVAQTELARHMANARVMVLPSFSEGLPRVVIEAMFTGTPVIATHVGGIPEMIQDGENGYLIEPDDVPSLLDALRKVYTHPDYATMGENARTFAHDFFSPAMYAEGYKRVVEVAER